MNIIVSLISFSLAINLACTFSFPNSYNRISVIQHHTSINTHESRSTFALNVFKERVKEETRETITTTEISHKPGIDDTEKYGLEVGLFKSLQKKDGGATAQSLLKKYGIAYLATSIPLAIVSYTICYTLVDSGVDVQSLLSNVGINTEIGDKVGTAAIAYAAHKAASPIRFPPTVALTPVVAKLIGKDPVEEE